MLKKLHEHKAVQRCPFVKTLSSTVCLLTILNNFNGCLAVPCNEYYWWDSIRHSCIECRICDNESIVLRGCQTHSDTVCGQVADITDDWSWQPNTEPINTKRIWSKTERDSTTNNINVMMWDWQTTTLALAVSACLLFFIAAACITLQHAKQWREMERMERRFDRDIEELSSRLMNTVVDVRAIENGKIILHEPNPNVPINPMDIRCIYLEQLLVGKDPMARTGRSNVYIERKN